MLVLLSHGFKQWLSIRKFTTRTLEHTSCLTVFHVRDIRAAPWENQQSAYAKTKTQISFAVTAKLISAFVFATRIVQFLFYLKPKFQASSSFLCLYRPVCVGPFRKPHCWFSHETAHFIITISTIFALLRYVIKGHHIKTLSTNFKSIF